MTDAGSDIPVKDNDEKANADAGGTVTDVTMAETSPESTKVDDAVTETSGTAKPAPEILPEEKADPPKADAPLVAAEATPEVATALPDSAAIGNGDKSKDDKESQPPATSESNAPVDESTPGAQESAAPKDSSATPSGAEPPKESNQQPDYAGTSIGVGNPGTGAGSSPSWKVQGPPPFHPVYGEGGRGGHPLPPMVPPPLPPPGYPPLPPHQYNPYAYPIEAGQPWRSGTGSGSAPPQSHGSMGPHHPHPGQRHPHMPPANYYPPHMPRPPYMGHPPMGPYWGPSGSVPRPEHAPPGAPVPLQQKPSNQASPAKQTSAGSKTPDERFNEVDGREGATSPSQIELSHRDEVEHMGCTCKKTRCLKLYCQCFGVQIYCGDNCRCIQCSNTHKHEKARKEAMRAILTRNPMAFDTKFKKLPTGGIPAMPGPAKTPPELAAKALTHKLGCKCRKSACMKKYCECYAGNVKCSGNCRCMGCKNMVAHPYDRDGAMGAPALLHHPASLARLLPGPPPIPSPATVMQSVMATGSGSHAATPGKRPGTAEPWTAAKNLTFLKHGTSSEEKKEQPTGTAPLDSMPSLASSSEGTSPGEIAHTVSTNPSFVEEGINSLMMAAYAMTEFGQGSSPSKRRADKMEPSKKDAVATPSTCAEKEAKHDSGDSASIVSGGEDDQHDSATPGRRSKRQKMSAPATAALTTVEGGPIAEI